MINTNYIYKLGSILICALCIVIFYSFSQINNGETKPQSEIVIPLLVKTKLEDKLNRYKNIILEKCRKEAIAEAEIYVDSLVSEELNALAGDTIVFPKKPIRPGLPSKVILNDSTKIDPIF